MISVGKPDAYRLKAIQKPQGKSRGRCDCRYPSPDKTSHTIHLVSDGGVFIYPPLRPACSQSPHLISFGRHQQLNFNCTGFASTPWCYRSFPSIQWSLHDYWALSVSVLSHADMASNSLTPCNEGGESDQRDLNSQPCRISFDPRLRVIGSGPYPWAGRWCLWKFFSRTSIQWPNPCHWALCNH